MKRKSTTANRIMETINSRMVKVINVELYYKNSHELKTIQPKIFVDELKTLSNLNLFSEMTDFEYELICTEKQIDNEKIQLLCGYKNYYFPYCINAILEINTNQCRSIDHLIQKLIKI